jgi:hypothetical protein
MQKAILGTFCLVAATMALAACGKKSGDNAAVPSGTATMPPVASEPPPPPPPPRIVDCTPAQQQAAEPALVRFGRDFQSKGFLATTFVSDAIKTCQFDTQTGRIMALGEYRFKGQMNHDELTFTVNFDTDATGGNPAFSNFLPDARLERIVSTKRRVLDFLKTVKTPEDMASAIPVPDGT